LGDPIVEKYASGEFGIVKKAELITVSEQSNGSCAFKVEAQISDIGKGGLLIPKYLRVTLDQGNVIVNFTENHQLEVVSPADKVGNYDASAASFTLNLNANVDIVRNGDFIVVIDKTCDTKVGYDSEGLHTTATIVVDKENAKGLTGKCGECEID